jgi:hypothetical protein
MWVFVARISTAKDLGDSRKKLKNRKRDRQKNDWQKNGVVGDSRKKEKRRKREWQKNGWQKNEAVKSQPRVCRRVGEAIAPGARPPLGQDRNRKRQEQGSNIFSFSFPFFG